MVLDEIGAGKRVVVKISRDDETAEFETIVIERTDSCLVVEPIMHEGQRVDFSTSNVKKVLQVVDEAAGKLFEWRDVSIKSGMYKKTTACHLIYVKGDAVEVNRRLHFRQFIGLPGMVMPLSGENITIDVKDVSNFGVGFVCDNKGQLEAGSRCVVVFTDEEYRFDLNALIIWEKQLANGRYSFGCKVSKAPAKLPMYIAHKQMENRRNSMSRR